MATVAVYVADWPAEENGAAQLGVGFALGLVAWLFFSLVFCRSLTRPESANSDIYGELCVRVTSLDARVPHEHEQWTVAQAEAYELLRSHIGKLKRELKLVGDSDGVPDRTSNACLPWLLAYGYVNLWRHVHRAEEALIELERPENLYVVAIADRARLLASSVEGHDLLAKRLGQLLGDGESTHEAARSAGGELAMQISDPGATLDPPSARAVLRESRYTLNRYRNDLWDQLVRLRNLLFATHVVTGIVIYAVLGLAVLMEVDRGAVAAAIAFYLVGAVVGLFGELYATSRRAGGAVNDYGLALIHVLTVPLISGIAAVGGVLLTRLAATSSDGIPPLTEIFSLSDYPAGLIVAAIFGLTPGLLLEQLRSQTEEYKKEIETSGTGGRQQAPEGTTTQAPS